jgi:hypothetical protein
MQRRGRAGTWTLAATSNTDCCHKADRHSDSDGRSDPVLVG